jgi:hypothetical protein
VVANRLGLTLNVGEEGGVVISLQPLFDERPEDDLEAHRELERDRCLPGNFIVESGSACWTEVSRGSSTGVDAPSPREWLGVGAAAPHRL